MDAYPVGERPAGVDPDPSCLQDRVLVGAKEDEPPALRLLLPDQAGDFGVRDPDARVLLAVRDDDEELQPISMLP